MGDNWFSAQDIVATEQVVPRRKKLRYRPPWKWNWWRIYCALFWLVMLPLFVVAVYLAVRP